MRSTLSARTALIIDLDFTLVKTNTTFEFMMLLCPIKYTVFSRLLKPILLLNMVFKRDLYKLSMALICLRRRKKEDLERITKIYYEKIVKKNHARYFNNHILAFVRMNEYKMRTLLTASLDFIANNFKELGFDLVVASKTCYKDGTFHSFFDLYKQKGKIVKILSRYFDKVVVIDDDPEPELQTLGKKVIVIKVLNES